MTIGNDGPPVRDPRQDPDFDPVAESKLLLRTVRTATLATLTPDGAPFATLTTVATDYDGAPLLLLSALALHTRHLERDNRLSLLLAQAGGRGDPLTHPRLTLAGAIARTQDPAARARFLRRNPKAQLYADFADFSFWRMEPTIVHVNGGFARAGDFGPRYLLTEVADAAALVAAEAETLETINADASGALARCAATFSGAKGGRWRASGLDPEGIDLVSGENTARLVFGGRATSPQAALAELDRLAKAA
jgi:hypothetical protein